MLETSWTNNLLGRKDWFGLLLTFMVFFFSAGHLSAAMARGRYWGEWIDFWV